MNGRLFLRLTPLAVAALLIISVIVLQGPKTLRWGGLFSTAELKETPAELLAKGMTPNYIRSWGAGDAVTYLGWINGPEMWQVQWLPLLLNLAGALLIAYGLSFAYLRLRHRHVPA